MSVVQLCQAKKGRGTCGRKARAWVRNEGSGWGGVATHWLTALCDRCTGTREVIERIEQ